MPLPNYVAVKNYTISYTQGDTLAYKTERKAVGKGKDKAYLTTFTELTVAEYTTEIEDNWS